jgi:hypothetical protein
MFIEVRIRDNEMCYSPQSMGRDCATGWTVPWSNPGRGEIFCTRPDRSWGPPSLLYNRYRVLFPEVKWPRHGDDHPPPSTVEVKERAELCIYSPCGSLWTLLGWTISLLSTIVITVLQQRMETYPCVRSSCQSFGQAVLLGRDALRLAYPTECTDCGILFHIKRPEAVKINRLRSDTAVQPAAWRTGTLVQKRYDLCFVTYIEVIQLHYQ